ncbi:MAG: SulP family inorganic anion transporter [Pirellulaceae bacterium]
MDKEKTTPLNDVIAAVIVFLVALPLCLGIAHASGAPLEAGLFAGIIGGLIVGSLSGSSTSVSGPAAGLIIIVTTQVETLGGFRPFLAALVVAGVIQLLLGVIRAGFLSEFIPSAVIKGLLAAIGITLILKQIPHIAGVDKDDMGEFSFWQPDAENTFSEIWHMISKIHPGALLVGVVAFALLIFWDRFKVLKKLPVPSALLAVVVGMVMTYVFDRMGGSLAIGVDHKVQVPVATDFKSFLNFFQTPDFSKMGSEVFWIAAVTIAIVASLETLLNLEAVDKLDPQKRLSPPNRELFAQGVGNMASGLIGGLPVTSVIVRSSVNVSNRNHSKGSAILHGALLLAFFYFLPNVLNDIPLSCLAAILIVTGVKLANYKLFRQMWSEGLDQFIPFVVTILAIIFTDLLIGILLGLAVSLLFILHSNFQNPLKTILEKHVGGDVLRIVLANQVSFLNRGKLKHTLDSLEKGSHVLIDARGTDYVDADVMDMIMDFRDEVAPAHGVKMSFLGFKKKYEHLDDHIQFVDYTSRDIQEKATPDQVLQILKDGNARFQKGETLTRNFGRQVDATKSGQFPLAVVLSCIDSRTPAEIVFDLGLGDVFSVRIAGNVAREKVLGSMEFGCAVAGAKLIFVMGHTRCGAVTKAVELFSEKTTADKELGCGHIDSLLSEIQKSIDPNKIDRSTLSNADTKGIAIDDVARVNVKRTMTLITERSPKLAELQAKGAIKIVGGLYDVQTGVMEYIES